MGCAMGVRKLGEGRLLDWDMAMLPEPKPDYASMSLEQATALALRVRGNALRFRASNAATYRAFKKIWRAALDRDKAGKELERLPAGLTDEERSELSEGWQLFEGEPNAEMIQQRVIPWAQGVGSVLPEYRGVGNIEEEDALYCVAWVLLDWRNARGLPMTATKYTSRKPRKPKEGEEAEETFTTDDGNEHVYKPSEAVKWLAGRVCEIDPDLAIRKSNGCRTDIERDYEWTKLWQQLRGRTRQPKNGRNDLG